MAKFTISVDTNKDNKEFKVTIDGETIENVSYVSADQYGDEVYISVSTYEKGDNGVRKTVNYSASGSEKFQEANKIDSKALGSVLLRRNVE